MKNKILIVSILFLFPFGKAGTGYLNAQSFSATVVGSSGTFATSIAGSMAWTIGEVMTETYSSTTNFFTQGFHQPDTLSTVSVMSYSPENISIFPNPVVDQLYINLTATSGDHVLYVYDMKGQLLHEEKIAANEELVTVSFREFNNGVYFINVINTSSSVKNSFKVIKTN